MVKTDILGERITWIKKYDYPSKYNKEGYMFESITKSSTRYWPSRDIYYNHMFRGASIIFHIIFLFTSGLFIDNTLQENLDDY